MNHKIPIHIDGRFRLRDIVGSGPYELESCHQAFLGVIPPPCSLLVGSGAIFITEVYSESCIQSRAFRVDGSSVISVTSDGYKGETDKTIRSCQCIQSGASDEECNACDLHHKGSNEKTMTLMKTSTLEDVLQCSNFETWLLACQQDQQSTSNTMLGVRPAPSASLMTLARLTTRRNCSASCCFYSERAPPCANRTFNRSPVVAEQHQFPGVDRPTEFAIPAVSHEHDEDLTRFCLSVSIGAGDGRPPPPPYEFATNGPIVFVQNSIVVRLGQGQANNAKQR
ncbi:hypothetical protein C8R48DRAFT_676776 [Suillus tomentosus]|nr:hypothetical protein C8R48DRAFT_676776 [Suillus tomentosus]